MKILLALLLTIASVKAYDGFVSDTVIVRTDTIVKKGMIVNGCTQCLERRQQCPG